MIDAYSVLLAAVARAEDLDDIGLEALAREGITPEDVLLLDERLYGELWDLVRSGFARLVNDDGGYRFVETPPKAVHGVRTKGGDSCVAFPKEDAAEVRERALEWLEGQAQDEIQHLERTGRGAYAYRDHTDATGRLMVPDRFVNGECQLYYSCREQGEPFVSFQPVHLGPDNLARAIAGQIHSAERDALGEPAEARLVEALGGKLKLEFRPGIEVAVIERTRVFEVWPLDDWRSEIARRKAELEELESACA